MTTAFVFAAWVADVKRVVDLMGLVMAGGELTADMHTCEELADVIKHILRHVVENSLELPAQRVRAGKPASGTIHLQARQTTTKLILEITHDGAGLNEPAIKHKGLRKNLLHAEDANATPTFAASEPQVLPEYATTDAGMAAARAAVLRLNGSLQVQSTPGSGSVFTIQLPIGTATTPVIVVRVGNHSYAIPSAAVETTRLVTANDILIMAGHETIRENRQPVSVVMLEELLMLRQAQPVAQVLLTRGDLTRRRSYLNARHTLLALLDQQIIPIVNENDTVSTEEIRVGDNDNLSALVANLVEADLLLLLTDQAGLFSADPRTNPQAQLLHEISSAEIPAAVWEAAGANGAQGTGGMLTKLQAAGLARQSGVATVIAAGSEPQVVLRVARGEALGTRLPALVSALESRKRYILSGWDGQARVQVDGGAAAALARGSSLLPVGVAAVHGEFERGDTLAVLDAAGHELARGLANYAANELRIISGQRSDQITALLGYEYGDEVIHRDHLVLLARPVSAL